MFEDDPGIMDPDIQILSNDPRPKARATRAANQKAKWFYPQGWKYKPMKIPPLNSSCMESTSSATISEANKSQMSRNQNSSVAGLTIKRPLPKIICSPQVASGSGTSNSYPRTNRFPPYSRHKLLPMSYTAKTPVIRKHEPMNLLEALEELTTESPIPLTREEFRIPEPIRFSASSSAICRNEPKNLADVLKICGADPPAARPFVLPSEHKMLPITERTNSFAIGTNTFQNVADVYEQRVTNFPTPRPSQAIVHRKLIPVIRKVNHPVNKPNNLIDVFEQFATDSPISQPDLRKAIPIKEKINLPAKPAQEQKNVVDVVDQGASESLITTPSIPSRPRGRPPINRKRRIMRRPQILKHERSVALAPRAVPILLQEKLGVPAESATAEPLTMPALPEVLDSDGERFRVDDYSAVEEPTRPAKRYFVRNPKQDIKYDVDTLYYCVGKYAALENKHIVVVWHENFDVAIATSIALKSTDCLVCVRDYFLPTVSDLQPSNGEANSQISIGSSPVQSFHCFAYGRIILSDAITEDRRFDSVQSFETRLAGYAAAQGCTLLNLFEFSQFYNGWCRIIGVQLREKVVVAKKM